MILHPDNIASIDILKDASATAIFGSRGPMVLLLLPQNVARIRKQLPLIMDM